jgi:hypothetical protein
LLPAAARDQIVASGITINGIAVLSQEPWLADYYRSNVIGGPAAFVVTARTFGDFAEAMLRKLTQEIVSASAAAAPVPGTTISSFIEISRRPSLTRIYRGFSPMD